MTATLSPIVDIHIDEQLVITAVGRMALDGQRVVREIGKACQVIQEIVAGTNEILRSPIASDAAKELARHVQAQYQECLTSLEMIAQQAGIVSDEMTAVARAPRTQPKRR